MSRPAHPLRVLLVDDHQVVRAGYRQLIEHGGDGIVVAEAGDANQAYAAYRATQPDVVVMDVMLPGASGIDAIRHIVRLDAGARILVFTMHGHPAIGRQALAAGALGLLTKDCDPDDMLAALHRVAGGLPHPAPVTGGHPDERNDTVTGGDPVAGRTVTAAPGRSGPAITPPCPAGAAARHRDGAGPDPAASPFDRLTAREFEATLLLLHGHRPDRIAALLSLSGKTVANLLSLARQKLGTDTDIALFRLAIEAGLLDGLSVPVPVPRPPQSPET